MRIDYPFAHHGGGFYDGILVGLFSTGIGHPGVADDDCGSRFFWTIIYKCLSYCENDNICNVIDI
ncbi:MAG: hypothetical protein HFJ38_06840 [Bacilli bacterium]|nr:hypothetical protein [Bacilli bacterium]